MSKPSRVIPKEQYEVLVCIGGPCDGQKERVDIHRKRFAIQKRGEQLDMLSMGVTYHHYDVDVLHTPISAHYFLRPVDQTPDVTTALFFTNYKGKNSNV